jgi:pentatricopeptide repeat protein
VSLKLLERDTRMVGLQLQTLLLWASVTAIFLRPADAQTDIGRISQRGSGACSNIVNSGGTVNATCVTLSPEVTARVLNDLETKGISGEQAARRLEVETERLQAFTQPEVEGLSKEASALAKRGRFKEAEAIYREMITKEAGMDPKRRASLHYAFGTTYSLQSSFASAKKEYGIARELDPADVHYCLAFAFELLDTGEEYRRASDRADYNECARRFRKLASEQPSKFEEHLVWVLDAAKFFYDFPELTPYLREALSKAEALSFRDPEKYNPALLQQAIVLGGVAVSTEPPDSFPTSGDARDSPKVNPAEAERHKRDNDSFVALQREGLAAALIATRTAREVKATPGSVVELQRVLAPFLAVSLWKNMQELKINVQGTVDLVALA